MKNLKRFYYALTSTRAGGAYILLIAFLIGLATFIENDFGTSAAQKVIFKTHWFEGLLFLFGLSIFQNIITFRMFQRKKWFMLLFHAAIILILIGALVTRYFGFEGSMHIREGAVSNTLQSRDAYINFKASKDGKRYAFHLPVLFSSLGNNRYAKDYIIGKIPLKVEVLDFIPNPTEEMKASDDGVPMLWVVQGGRNGRSNYYVPFHTTRRLDGLTLQFGDNTSRSAPTVQFDYRNDSLLFMSRVPMTRMTMATRALDTVMPGKWYPAKLRSLHSGNGINFVIKEFNPKAKLVSFSSSKKLNGTDEGAVRLRLSTPKVQKEVTIRGAQAYNGAAKRVDLGPIELYVDYGPRAVTLPFALQLTDFRLEKYPGTERPASYESDVILLDPAKKLKKPYKIYMNHVLDHNGYRFFQSSYDQDEKGTILSVNHDWWGTWISYVGYILFTIGLLAMFFSGVSRFRKLSKHID